MTEGGRVFGRHVHVHVHVRHLLELGEGLGEFIAQLARLDLVSLAPRAPALQFQGSRQVMVGACRR